jgi:hypothetical protein
MPVGGGHGGRLDVGTVRGQAEDRPGAHEKGARVIEVWRSADDAQAFAEKSRPFLEAAKLPAPSRVVGFEVTSYIVS